MYYLLVNTMCVMCIVCMWKGDILISIDRLTSQDICI
jgi:hypothetical protein